MPSPQGRGARETARLDASRHLPGRLARLALAAAAREAAYALVHQPVARSRERVSRRRARSCHGGAASRVGAGCGGG
eukprot:3591402-Prymnesium_polylepis.1